MEDNDFFDEADRLLARLDFAAHIDELNAAHQRQLRALLLSFIEVKDAFDGFFDDEEARQEHDAPASDRLPRIRLIARQLEQALTEAGVVAISCLGEQAEPGRHRIVSVRNEADAADNEIVDEIFCGYEWDGTLLRKPQVIVAHRTQPA